MKTNVTTLSKLPALSLVWVIDSITAILARLNAGYDDYDIRAEMGELTREEARAELQAGIDCQEQNQVSGGFWSGG